MLSLIIAFFVYSKGNICLKKSNRWNNENARVLWRHLHSASWNCIWPGGFPSPLFDEHQPPKFHFSGRHSQSPPPPHPLGEAWGWGGKKEREVNPPTQKKNHFIKLCKNGRVECYVQISVMIFCLGLLKGMYCGPRLKKKKRR